MRALPLLLLGIVALSGCRLLSGEVACRLHRDCPKDVGLDFCEAPGDGGVGRCVPDDPRPVDDGDGGPLSPLDAG